jgi:hypothetical protein
LFHAFKSSNSRLDAPSAGAESRAQPPAEAGIQFPFFYIVLVMYPGSDDAMIITGRSGFERLLRVLRRREEVRTATGAQSSSYFAMRQPRLPKVRCDNWKSCHRISPGFPDFSIVEGNQDDRSA